MAPSVYLLPPAESNFRHFNLPQNVLSFSQTPVPLPREKNSLRRRKRPRLPHSESAVNGLTTEDPNRVVNLVTYDNFFQTTVTPTISTVTYHSTEISSPVIDLSETRAETLLSASHSSTSTTSQSTVRTDHALVSYQSQSFDSPDVSSDRETPEVLNEFSSNEKTTNTQETLRRSETSSSHSHKSSQLDFSFIESGRILPPSTDLSPPVYQNFNDIQFSFDEGRNIPYPQEGDQRDFIITSSPNLTKFPNESPAAISGRTAQAQNLSRTQNQLSNYDSLPQHVKNNYSSLMAVIVDMFGDKNAEVKSIESPSNDRRQQQFQSRRRLKSRVNTEDEYDELQLTAAETAYFRRRQLTQRPFNLLENTG